MIMLPRRCQLALVAVIDIALHARPDPVSLKQIAARHGLPPRHLETLLQALVRAGILKGVRGPRGGYELASERRRLTAGQIVRAAMVSAEDDQSVPEPHSKLVDLVIEPEIKIASNAFLAHLDGITVEQLCDAANKSGLTSGTESADFSI